MTPDTKHRRFQFSLASLLVVQALVSLTLGIWKGFGWPAVISIVALPSMLTLTVAGTVWIAREWDRSAQVAKVAFRIALIVVAATFLAWLANWAF